MRPEKVYEYCQFNCKTPDSETRHLGASAEADRASCGSGERKAAEQHLALLRGLLYCESCSTRMVYSYSVKGSRQYPYYVCLNAQRKGWAARPVKSRSARAIEESVLGQIRQAQRGLSDPAEWERTNRAGQFAAVQQIVDPALIFPWWSRVLPPCEIS